MKKFKMPSAYTIVFIFLVITAILTWIVPTSVVVENEGVKEVIFNASFDGDGNVLKGAGHNPAGLWDILMAPVKGYEKSAGVGIAILIAGAFLGVMNYVGAMDAGIGKLLNTFKGTTLIVILMFVFSIFGTVFGLWEEIPAFSIVIIPLFVMAGYDVMTGLAVLMVGATAGNMASIVNPFSTGAAISAIGNGDLSLGDGMIMRIVIFIILTGLGTLLVVNYANKVKKDKTRSVLNGVEGIETHTHDNKKLPELTKERFHSLIVFVVMIVLLIAGYMPWYTVKVGSGTLQDIVNLPITLLAKIPVIGTIFGAGNVTPLGDWYFGEFALLFLVGSIVIAFINKLSEEEFVNEFAKGAKDLLGVVLVLAVANGISVLMGGKTEGISVTFVYWIQNALQGIPTWAFSVAGVMAFIGIGFFLQSTSGVAGITMPILGAVAMALFQNSPIGAKGGQIILISAFTIGLNFMSGIYPGATTMGTLDLFKVPYNKFLNFMLKVYIPMIIVGVLIISIAPYIGLI